MKRLLPLSLTGLLLLGHPAAAQEPGETGREAVACLTAASRHEHVPRSVLLILLYVEGGRLGSTVRNDNGTYDLGPMQVNSSHVPEIARRWRTTPTRAWNALRDNPCANIEAGSHILTDALRETHGDLWQAVAFYHSHTPRFGRAYLQRVWTVTHDLMQTANTEKGS
ncbi:lytic transglycosylase domain-containing protein [Acetobacter conturbans]|uniref:Transglycosylase SLT domain-containing protein n=1 Tax=Acetobacter conturbans TaxID=1737472 RepID=A0ABX0K9A7_9PROT|nr:lytic transglycosylase domain-containing protein [Acetobacter conturbans]NHN89979.1 transglycosylase SLT domain-containing protein [Acetobacter conturbans]